MQATGIVAKNPDSFRLAPLSSHEASASKFSQREGRGKDQSAPLLRQHFLDITHHSFAGTSLARTQSLGYTVLQGRLGNSLYVRWPDTQLRIGGPNAGEGVQRYLWEQAR